jgi:hypothetical protein
MYDRYTGRPIPYMVNKGVCFGTKEQDECSCGGDRTKCDFYPEIREKVANEEEIVTGIPVDIGFLYDWYISSVGDEDPVWTEDHIDELFNDFYLIPKEN